MSSYIEHVLMRAATMLIGCLLLSFAVATGQSSHKLDELSEKGLAFDIAVDKGTYTIGENIPIHIKLKNINAPESMVTGPCIPAATSVRDVDEQRIRPSGTEVCVTGASVFGVLAHGETATFERTLDALTEPGFYTVDGTWPACVSHGAPTGLISADTSGPPEYPYAYVHSTPVTIRVIDPKHPERGRFTPSTAWPANFIQVETPFGPATALLDKTTWLKWLHIDLTDQKSYLGVRLEMAADAPLAGWRYATAEEVEKVKSDFYGPKCPNINDPKIEAVFQGAFRGYSIFGEIPGAPANGECLVMAGQHPTIDDRWSSDLELTPMCSYLVQRENPTSH